MAEEAIKLGRKKESMFIDKVKELLPDGGNLNLCLTCGACSSGCPATGIEGMDPRKFLRMAALGMDDDLLRYAVERGMRGVVLESLGGGRVPPWWMPTIRESLSRGVAVVVASRCPAGPAYDRYGYPGAHRDQREAVIALAEALWGDEVHVLEQPDEAAVYGPWLDPARRY